MRFQLLGLKRIDKKWYVFGGLCFVLVFVLAYCLFAATSADEDMEDPALAATPQPLAATSHAPQDGASVNIAEVYPFVAPDGSGGAVPSAPTEGQGYRPPPTASLPQIPNYQPPSYARGGAPLPQPEAPVNSGIGSAGMAKSQASIQGILTAEGEGGNIAMLSNGRLVREGDYFGSEKVNRIGPDGMILSNGSKIAYDLPILK